MTFETLNESYDLVVIGAGPAGQQDASRNRTQSFRLERARLLRAQLQSQT